MYAAAGGASLASRQKRKNQAAQNVKNEALLQQGLKDKLAATRASNLAPSNKAQSRQFHNLPSTYLRAPQAHVRKLSAGCTTQNKILVPINESNNQYFAHFHPHTHSNTPATTPHHHHHAPHHHHHHHDHTSLVHEHQHHQPHHFRATTPRPAFEHDPNTIHHHRLTKSATASIPLVSNQYSEITPPESPTCLLKPPVQSHIPTTTAVTAASATATVESHDPMIAQCIITPATPATTPGPQQPNTEQAERKCSIFRDRDKPFEFDEKFQKHEADYDDEYHVKHAVKTHHTTIATTASAIVVERWTDSECCDSDHQNSVCTCDHIECAQGRAAWLERGRRCSLSENAASCHRRWVKRNRIHDSTLSGSSDDDDFLGALRGPSSFANAFLYVGLGTVALGLVILFVGTGEKGFKTIELRLIGPSLIVIGLLCCMLRIFFCICPSSCLTSKRRKLKQKNAKVDVDHTTSLLCADNKRVLITRSNEPTSPDDAENFTQKLPQTKMNQGMETLRQLATTSLFLQSEKTNISNHKPVVRIDTENIAIAPTPSNEDKLEIVSISDDEEIAALLKLNTSNETSKLSSKQNDATPYSIMDAAVKTTDTSFVLQPVREEQPQPRPNKLSRSRAPLNQSKSKESKSLLMSLDTSPSTTTTTTATAMMNNNFNSNHNNNLSELMSQRVIENGACAASTLLSSIPSFSQCQNSSGGGSGNSGSSNNKNDGNLLPLSRLDSMSRSMHDASSTRSASTMPVQSAVTSFASNVNSIEPELVLSPAKLGQ